MSLSLQLMPVDWIVILLQRNLEGTGSTFSVLSQCSSFSNSVTFPRVVFTGKKGDPFAHHFSKIKFLNLCFRSRWLWSRFMPQSTYSPVKGLYLYGGVGTGKTMLMDLFFDQL